MPAPRQRPKRSVPAPIAEICNTVIDLLEHSGLTNEQALERSTLTVSKQTLSRILLGQNRTPPSPELVSALVTVVAAELDRTPDAVYDDNPVLRDHVNPSISGQALSSPERDIHLPVFLERVGWLWTKVLDGHEHEAAIALHGVFPEPSRAALALKHILARDPGSGAALLRALRDLHEPERLDSNLLRHLSVEDRFTLEQFDTNRYRDIEQPLWNRSHADLFDSIDNTHQIGRRLGALIARGDTDQAVYELVGLATAHDRGNAALRMLYAIIGTSRPSEHGIRHAITVLNSMVAPPAEFDESASVHAEVLHTIITAMVVDARASHDDTYNKAIIPELEPHTFRLLLRRFSRRDLLEGAPVGRANLVDLLKAAATVQINDAISRAGTDHSIDHLAEILLNDDLGTYPNRREEIKKIGWEALAKFLGHAVQQSIEHPTAHQRSYLWARLERFVLGCGANFIARAARSWPVESTERLIGYIARSGDSSAMRANAVAAAIVAIDDSYREEFAERVIAGMNRIAVIRVWVALIGRAPDIAKSLPPLVPLDLLKRTQLRDEKLRSGSYHRKYPAVKNDWQAIVDHVGSDDWDLAAAKIVRLAQAEDLGVDLYSLLEIAEKPLSVDDPPDEVPEEIGPEQSAARRPWQVRWVKPS